MPASTPVLLLEVGDIEPSPFQPRREFDTAALDSLGESIRTAGLMQPIIVRPSSRGSGRRYELVAGERRWRAVTRAGLGRLPAIVRSLSDAEAAEWAVVENLQREDLNPIERAEAFATLTGRFGLSHMDVATKVGLDRSSVTNFLRLLELEEPIRKLLSAGRLSFGHGRALLSAPAGSARVGLACDAAENSWSVRTLERAALSLARGGGAVRRGEVSETRAAREAARADLERQLSAHLGSKVILRPDRNGKKGRIVIEFYGLDHLDGLLSKLGYSPARGS